MENGIKPGRGTNDIDFAVMLPEMDVYEHLKERIIDRGFRKVNEPYRLIFDKTDTVIDLLPFGEIEEEGTVIFTDRKTELSVVGMKEVNDHSVVVNFQDFSITISPLVGIVILKLISFSDKPERKKDLDDIYVILNSYFEINKEEFYESHTDMLEEIETDNFILLAGARMMGRDIKKIIAISPVLTTRIVGILELELQEQTGSITQYFLSRELYKEHGLVKSIFIQILKGIEELKC
ncbi:MAG: hypothetical protein IPM91_00850 [Bacteroidetes bacterium]|nr:hypothetical protein [Bacteroidota bacterium]